MDDNDAHVPSQLPDEPAEIADCGDAIRQLYTFLDNELTDEVRVSFEAHLTRCGPCVEVVTFEAELRTVIANKCQDRVPTELIERICAAISKEAEQPR